MKKVLVISPVLFKENITRFCVSSWKRLNAIDVIDVEILLLVHRKEDAEWAKKIGVNFFFTQNHPIGRKVNNGFRHALSLEWDYVLYSDSETVISPKLLHRYYPYMEKGVDFIGSRKIYLTDGIEAKKIFTSSGGTFHPGRLISRHAIQKVLEVDRLYPDLDTGFDGVAEEKLKKYGFHPFIIDHEIGDPLMVDIKKEGESLHGMSFFTRWPDVTMAEIEKNVFTGEDKREFSHLLNRSYAYS